MKLQKCNLYDRSVPMITQTHCVNHPDKHAAAYDTLLRGYCASCEKEVFE